MLHEHRYSMSSHEIFPVAFAPPFTGVRDALLQKKKKTRGTGCAPTHNKSHSSQLQDGLGRGGCWCEVGGG